MRLPMFVFSADWHLKPNAWIKHPDLWGDAYFSLKQIVDFCVDNALPMVAGGDLFDINTPDTLSVSHAFRAMDRMQQAGLDVLFIQGQHEMRSPAWLSLHQWPKHIHKELFNINHIQLYGLDYSYADVFVSEAAKIPKKASVLIAHQVWEEFMGTRGQTDCNAKHLANVSHVFTGDFHKQTSVQAVGKFGQTVEFISPGSICLQSYNEPAEKYFLLVYDDLSVKPIKLLTRPIYRCRLDEPVDWDKWVNYLDVKCPMGADLLPNYLTKPILVVEYDITSTSTYNKIAKVCGDKYHLFRVPMTKQVETDNEAVLVYDVKGPGGLIDHLESFCDKSSTVYSIARQLLESQNPTEKLEELAKLNIGIKPVK